MTSKTVYCMPKNSDGKQINFKQKVSTSLNTKIKLFSIFSKKCFCQLEGYSIFSI